LKVISVGIVEMSVVYHDEVEIEDFEYDEESETYYYPCPCGDRFEISKVIEKVVFEVVRENPVIIMRKLIKFVFRSNWRMVKRKPPARAVHLLSKLFMIK